MAMNYYLGVKTVSDAANALSDLPFLKVLDKTTLNVEVKGIDRINMSAGPASKDNDLSKGIMIWIGGRFTTDEMNALDKLAVYADKSVTSMVAVFAAEQAVDMQRRGISATHKILGQA